MICPFYAKYAIPQILYSHIFEINTIKNLLGHITLSIQKLVWDQQGKIQWVLLVCVVIVIILAGHPLHTKSETFVSTNKFITNSATINFCENLSKVDEYQDNHLLDVFVTYLLKYPQI